MKYKNIINKMTLEEKISLCSGENFWRTKAFEHHNIPSIMLADGPHGIRKQEGESDHLGVNNSKKATCYPTAAAVGCSWDRKLVAKVADTLAKEASYENISVLLGPGINIKRNPLCGRNFEYFSEDPYLTGELGSAFVSAVEKNGISTSLKHFAANNQEHKRFESDSILDDRTLHEIYLSGFEKVIKEAKPSTVMCSYNKINGTQMSDNALILNDILRKKWGFDGLVVTDWGGMNDRIEAFKAGTDLEMPGGANYFDNEVVKAVNNGILNENYIDKSVNRILELVFRDKNVVNSIDYEEHHSIAKEAAEKSAVLLKNDDSLLPLSKDKSIAIIGMMADTIRYQGAGSSRINPFKLTNVLNSLSESSLTYSYSKGYHKDGSTTEELINDAIKTAKKCEVAVVFAGLPDIYESEGFDRDSLAMPIGHVKLIEEVAKANENTVVVLMAGSVIEMPWITKVKSVLHMHLSGQAVGGAIMDLLTGKVNPSGKLTETYPISYNDVPSATFYRGDGYQAQYREGIYVGYRYYDKANKDVLFPFGHGLSYASFSYSNIKCERTCNNWVINVTVKNEGSVYGEEIAQLYISDLQNGVHKPINELKGFEKIGLKPGEKEEIEFKLNERSIAYYDADEKDWRIQNGKYEIKVGSSSRDIRLKTEIEYTEGIDPKTPASLTWYDNLKGPITQTSFEDSLGYKIKPVKKNKRGQYTLDDSIIDMQDSRIMRIVYKSIRKEIGKTYGGPDDDNPSFKMSVISATEVPMKNLVIVSSGTMKKHVAVGLIHMANRRYLKGLKSFIFKKWL